MTLLSGLMLAACGAPSPEQQVLTDFFEASRVRDTTVLARFASVVFEPRTQGVVQSFEIVDFGEERPLPDGKVEKELTVNAQVRTPDGQAVPRAIVVTMQRLPGERRWFITATRPLTSQTSPAASSAPPS